MRVALYSEAGRADVRAARALVKEQGIPSTPEGIRRFRALAMDRLPEIVRRRDFYTLSECRDLVMHVQEHRFDIPRIKGHLEELGLRFLGFHFEDLQPKQLFHDRHPSPEAARDLDLWAALEEDHPRLFRNMYTLICQRAA